MSNQPDYTSTQPDFTLENKDDIENKNETGQSKVTQSGPLFATSDDGSHIPFMSIERCCLDESNLLYFKLLWPSNEMNENNPSVYWQSLQDCTEAAALATMWTEVASSYTDIVGIENFGTPTLSEMRQATLSQNNVPPTQTHST